MSIKRILKWTFIVLIGIIVIVVTATLLTPIPNIPQPDVVAMRQEVNQPFHLLETTDKETLFIRRWNPVDSLEKKGVAVLILHGITAHSKAYDFMAEPLSAAGYTTFGLDYRGHGLSGGSRGDSPSKERAKSDYLETMKFIKDLGFRNVVVIGHSFGVASAIYLAKMAPDETNGLVLLSGAYRGKQPARKYGWFEMMTIFTNSIIRPSTAVIEYKRVGMEKRNDPLFNYAYTLRFATMLSDQTELEFQQEPPMPILVGVGDQDELFTIDAVRELYDGIPGNNKEFWVIKESLHATFPASSWNDLINWLDKQGFGSS
ncbi:alpha/beta hydrolase [Pararhodonellum marinum]|uniref:alpha/beta hydrolase n=1 Tax=Pararhodonellum marinum TaxID=2755358 RepID=UPI00188EFF8E|nr:alpha/beta fold hydrolase [Pararhodonellum marinum]